MKLQGQLGSLHCKYPVPPEVKDPQANIARDSKSLKGLQFQLSPKFTVQERKACNLLRRADVQESFWQLHLSCCLPHSALLNPFFLLVICAFLIDNKTRQAQMSIMRQLFCRTAVLSSSYITVLLGPDAPSASRELSHHLGQVMGRSPWGMLQSCSCALH